MTNPVVVPIRSAWSSRINQIAVGLFGLAVPITALTPILPDKYKPVAIAAASFLGAVSIWYYKTFGTASVTASSVAQNASANSLETVLRTAGVSETQITDSLNANEALRAAQTNK